VQRSRRVGYALRVIAARVGDDAASAFFVGKRGDFVLGPAQLESSDGLQVFKFEKKPAMIVRARAQVRHFKQRRAYRDALQARVGLTNFVEGDDGKLLSFEL
jgi:hypothetical protein